MGDLAREFGARIEPRPLLVEAAIASDRSREAGVPSWVVLVDEDKFNVCPADILSETQSKPLPTRLRTTIAHELLHILTLNAKDGSIEIDLPRRPNETKAAYIKRVENEVEGWSSLLLIADAAIDALAKSPAVELKDLLELRRMTGVSREMLISRLALPGRQDPRMHHSGLENLAVGLIERSAEGTVCFLPKPIFQNFEFNRAPWFISKLIGKLPVRVRDVVSEPEFFVNGGDRFEVDLDGHSETERLDYMKMRVRLEVEPVRQNHAYRQLFTVRKLMER